jgi:hypothetical protein
VEENMETPSDAFEGQRNRTTFGTPEKQKTANV